MQKYKDKDDILDIVDESGSPTGNSKTYTEIHTKGLLHKTVHVWVVNSKKELLLQKRSNDVNVYPGAWNSSASGHIISGQSTREGAQMETMEELGLYIPLDSFEYLFTLKEDIVSKESKMIENAFNDIFLVHCDNTIEDFKMAKDEVAELKWVSAREFEILLKDKNEFFVPHHEEYEKLIEYLDKLGN